MSQAPNARHFTIIIPTRNRADTLFWTIKSCLLQNYDRMTVLVSNNCSTDNTKEVLASFNDPRLKVVTTPAPTSMSGNIEFALSHCIENDTFVTGIGDDDGILPDSLSYANDLLEQHQGIEALTWMTSNYCWPNCLIDSWQNNLQLSLSSHAEVLSSQEMLKKLAGYSVYYHHLPGLWTSFVSAKVLRQCKVRFGRVIIGPIPDAATAVLIPCCVPSYVFTQRSVTILGSSAHSNGVSCSNSKQEKTVSFLTENTLPIHPDLDFSTHGVYYVTESLLQARDLGVLPPGVAIDLPKALRLLLVRRSTDSDAMYASIRDSAASTAARHNIPFVYDTLTKQNELEHAAESLFADPIITKHASTFNHRCDPKLVSNIFEATRLSGEILNMHRSNLIVAAHEYQQVMDEKKLALHLIKAKLEKCKDRNNKLEGEIASVKNSQKKGVFAKLRKKFRM